MAEAQYHDPALAAFHDWDCPWSADHDWFASLVEGAASVLTVIGRPLQALARLAFPGFDEVSGLILAAGLQVERWAGDASGGPLLPGCPDFIPIGALAG